MKRTKNKRNFSICWSVLFNKNRINWALTHWNVSLKTQNVSLFYYDYSLKPQLMKRSRNHWYIQFKHSEILNATDCPTAWADWQILAKSSLQKHWHSNWEVINKPGGRKRHFLQEGSSFSVTSLVVDAFMLKQKKSYLIWGVQKWGLGANPDNNDSSKKLSNQKETIGTLNLWCKKQRWKKATQAERSIKKRKCNH